jgi:hypothetical protein
MAGNTRELWRSDFTGQVHWRLHLRRSQPRPGKTPKAGVAGSNPAGGTREEAPDRSWSGAFGSSNLSSARGEMTWASPVSMATISEPSSAFARRHSSGWGGTGVATLHPGDLELRHPGPVGRFSLEQAEFGAENIDRLPEIAGQPRVDVRLVVLHRLTRKLPDPAHSPRAVIHQRSWGTVGRVTGTTVRRSSSPLKSSGLVVKRGRSSATAMAAIIRSATRRRGLRPALITAAQIRP